MELDKRLINHNKDMNMEMRLEFTTWEDDGLLVWQGVNDWFEQNFMAVGSKFIDAYSCFVIYYTITYIVIIIIYSQEFHFAIPIERWDDQDYHQGL